MVCFDVPYPPDYGGAIDMFYKLVSLHEAGVKVHLHYFSYNHRGNPNELNQYCETIHVYERKTGHKGFSLGLPYIVSSRINAELIDVLSKDNYPVLLEGIHCSGIAKYICNNRKVVIRMHNDESAYYQQLAQFELNLAKKLYYWNESRLLNIYQRSLPENCIYASICKNDINVFQQKYQIKDARYLPAFIPFKEVISQEGAGNFCLYHGNLSVAENEKTAVWLMQQVFSKIKQPLVIAGKDPSARLEKLVNMYENTCLVQNPTCMEMNDLVQKAHIHILPSFNKTGIKLKLLQAVFAGRHCITNEEMIKGTGVEAACHTGSTADAIASIILQLYHQPFTFDEILLRKKLLKSQYDNAKNAAELMTWI
jgi:hypothetical protein